MALLLLALVLLLVGCFTAAMWVSRYLTQQQQTRSASHLQDEIDHRLDRASRQASNRLVFRQPELSDRSFYLEMARDETAAEANGWGTNEVAVITHRFDNPDRFTQLRDLDVVAVERATGTPVATATVNSSPLDREHAVSIGIHVHPTFRNKGYGREVMAGAILIWAADGVPVHVGTRATNLGLRRIMEQLGYTPFDTNTPYLAPNGERYPALWYQCGRDTHPPAGLSDISE